MEIEECDKFLPEAEKDQGKDVEHKFEDALELSGKK